MQNYTLIVALSIAMTPILMALYNRYIAPLFINETPEPEFDEIITQNTIILAGFGRFGQVIGRFLTAQGVKLTILEKDPDQIEMIRKFGYKGYFGDATRLDLLKSAGAQDAQLMIIAVDDIANSLEIAQIAKDHFPNLVVFARARNRQHAYELNNLGVSYFKRELFDSSLNMAQEIMVWLGKRRQLVSKKAEQFREHDEKTLRDSFQFFDDEPALVNFSKTRRAELENILQGDMSDEHEPIQNKVG